MKKTIILLPVLLGIIFYSCNTTKKKTATYGFEKVWETDTLLTTSESALYDAANDVIYVSCINEGPRTQDGEGFIARVSPDGEILDRQWITGMHAPKGLGMHNNTLYAADIKELLAIDITEGSIKQRFPVENAGMLNDLTVAANGDVYFTDMDSAIIYTLSAGELNVFMNDGLNRPNGLLHMEDKLLMLSMGSGELFAIDFDSMQKDKLADGLNGADGVIKVANDTYLVSDWNGEIFLIDPAGQKTSLLNTKEEKINTADLGFMPDKNIVLVPTFGGHSLAAYKLTLK